MWYLFLATVGMVSTGSMPECSHVFLPYVFSLEELAPQHGADVSICLLEQNTQKAEALIHQKKTEEIILSIVPGAHIDSIPAYTDTQASCIDTLHRCSLRLPSKKYDIMHAGLTIIHSSEHYSRFHRIWRRLFHKSSFLVSAVGNNNYINEAATIEFPALFAGTSFDVGAYGYDDSRFFIPFFSQYSPQQHPLIVMPGVAIHGATGTSFAAAVMTGFLALVYAEGKRFLSPAQILTVCYACCVRHTHSAEWYEKTVLGTCDMHLTLFVVQVLKLLKQLLAEGSYSFDTHFRHIVEAILGILYKTPQSLGCPYPFPFQEGVTDYLTWCGIDKKPPIHRIYPTACDAQQEIADSIYRCITTPAADEFQKQLTAVLYAAKDSLFAHHSIQVQQLLNTKIRYHNRKCLHNIHYQRHRKSL